MPHERLTPLGKQLRTVLVNLSTTRNAPAHATLPLPLSAPSAAILGSSKGREKAIATASAAVQTQEQHGNHLTASFLPPKASARVIRRRARVNHVRNALEATGKAHLLYYRPVHKPDLTYVHPKRGYAGIRIARQNKQRHALKDGPRSAHHRAISLQSTLGKYMTGGSPQAYALAAEWEPTEWESAEWEPAYQPSPEEAEYLAAKGHSVTDVEVWAEIVAEEDTHEAARKLAARNASSGVLSTPLFAYLSLLARPTISARALRLLVGLARSIFDERAQLLENPGVDSEPRFLAAVRLLRHARKVWPACMLAIVRLVLEEPARDQSIDAPDNATLATKTYKLNKLMSLVSMSTSEQTFKNRDHQEAALIPILQYMSEHPPPLHINREGYRAVVRLQLAQRKTAREQQWAELKALSWPPWKEDRTGMDALITKEDHGTSQAGQTLLRMREAGYAHHQWEHLAGIHAGWDVDGTPTIQNRVRLAGPGFRLSRKSSTAMAESVRWAARITSTRTVQEAWACYLAWEDKHLPLSQDVFLAIATKLREEQRRPHVECRRAAQDEQRKAWPLFPGDAKEISPLPPSTHLETYTRTRPPTVEDFYEDLRGRRIPLGDHALAFFVRHARTLPFGLAVLRNGAAQYPAINHFFSPELPADLSKVPAVVYAAAVNLFARFSNVPRALRTLPDTSLVLTERDLSEEADQGYNLNYGSGIVHAIHLLRLRPDTDDTIWHIVHQNLTRGYNVGRFANIFLDGAYKSSTSDQESDDLAIDLRQWAGAFQAYRLSSFVRKLQAQTGVELGPSEFSSFCVVTEYRAIATWSVLQAVEGERATQQKSAILDRLVSAAKHMLIGGKDEEVCLAPVKLFSQLLGAAESTAEVDDDKLCLPRLLNVPDPALLHAYIRALGWVSQYQNLLDLTRWMREYRAELLERMRQDRNGEEMMRRAIVALRVFLERSWLPKGTGLGVDGQTRSEELKFFLKPARDELIDRVKTTVEEVDEWEGWPSDDEVEQYAAGQRFKGFTEYEMDRKVRRDNYVPLVPVQQRE